MIKLTGEVDGQVVAAISQELHAALRTHPEATAGPLGRSEGIPSRLETGRPGGGWTDGGNPWPGTAVDADLFEAEDTRLVAGGAVSQQSRAEARGDGATCTQPG